MTTSKYQHGRHQNAQARRFFHHRGISSSFLKAASMESKGIESKSSGTIGTAFYGLRGFSLGALLPLFLTAVNSLLTNSEYAFQTPSGSRFKMIDTQSRNWSSFIAQDVLKTCNVSSASYCEEVSEVGPLICYKTFRRTAYYTIHFMSCVNILQAMLNDSLTVFVDCVSDMVNKKCGTDSNLVLNPYTCIILAIISTCCLTGIGIGVYQIRKRYCSHNAEQQPLLEVDQKDITLRVVDPEESTNPRPVQV